MKRIIILAAIASLGVTASAEARLRDNTARLARDRTAVQISRSSPGWDISASTCNRINARHINCGLEATRTDPEGIKEEVIYTVHVYEVDHGGYRAYSTNSGVHRAC